MQDSSYSQQNTIRRLMLGVFPQKIRLLFGRKKINIIISITWYKIKRELTFKCSYFAFFCVIIFSQLKAITTQK